MRRHKHSRRRPYRVECTGSLSTSEVKQHRARLVLGWGTAWEDLGMLSASVDEAILASTKKANTRPGFMCLPTPLVPIGKLGLPGPAAKLF